MQRTANFHHQIADTRLVEAAGLMDHAAALDAAVDVLDARATAPTLEAVWSQLGATSKILTLRPPHALQTAPRLIPVANA